MPNKNNLFIQIPDMEQGTAEWHEWRSKVIGASDAPAIMGENPWKSKKTLIKEKLGILKQFSGNAATRRGSQLEPEARRIYTSITNNEVEPAVLQSKNHPWQAASLDGINTAKEIIVEIKCGIKSYEYTKQTNKVPLYYKAQLQHILCVTGLESIDYFSYFPGEKPLLISVYRDENYIQELITAELKFLDTLKLFGFSPRNTLYVATNSSTNTSSQTKQTLQNGDTFEGNFVDGKRNGYGVYTWANGDRYEGNWIEGKRTGKGIYLWTNGERYEGDWIDSWQTGKGIFTWPDGKRAEGIFLDDELAKGIFTWPDGERYEGDFVDYLANGKGIFTWSNGNRYEGDFVDYMQSGKGIFTWPNGDRYEGDFLDNVQIGKGIFTRSNGERYEGEFANNSYHGKGIFTWANKTRYEGEYRDGKFDGYGILTWYCGDFYEGFFEDGNPHGEGKFTLNNGDYASVIWEKGIAKKIISTNVFEKKDNEFLKPFQVLKSFMEKEYVAYIKETNKSKRFLKYLLKFQRQFITDFEIQIAIFQRSLDQIESGIFGFKSPQNSIQSYRSIIISQIQSKHYFDTAEKFLKNCDTKLNNLIVEFERLSGDSLI